MAVPRQNDGQQQALRDQLEPVVHGLGLVLDDVLVSTAGAQRLVRVVLDLPAEQPGSVSLDAIADAAREISAELDAADPMGQSPYTLEVSSPGVERPLTQPRHLRRNVGRVVLLTLVDETTVTGRVLSVGDDDSLVLLLPGAKKGMPATKQRVVPFEQVVIGVVQVEFNHVAGAPEDTAVSRSADGDLDDDVDDDDVDDDDDDLADDDLDDDETGDDEPDDDELDEPADDGGRA